MNCDPDTLSQSAKCYRCIPKGRQAGIIAYLLCQWANHLTPPCVPPGQMTIAIDTIGSGFVSLLLNAGVPPATLNIIVCWGTTNGGPYPNCITHPFAGPILPNVVITTGDGLIPGVIYYFVAYANNGFGCVSPASNQVSGTPLPPPGTATPVWQPTTEQVTWTDTNGTFTGDYPTFHTTVDTASLSSMVFGGTGNITSLTSLATAPNLVTLDVNTNALTTLNCTGLAALTTLNCSSNGSLTTLTLTGCIGLVTLDCTSCDITGALDMTGLSSLTTLTALNNSNLTSFNLTGCASIQSIDISSCNLGTVNTSGITTLLGLTVGFNNLTSVNVTGCTGLTTLNIDGNPALTACTGLGTCTNLQFLDLTGDNFASINVSTLTALLTLTVSNNPLGTLDCTGLVALDTLNANGCSLTALVLTGCAALTSLDCSLNSLASLDVSICPNLSSLQIALNPAMMTLVLSGTKLTQIAADSLTALTSINLLGCSLLVQVSAEDCALTTNSVNTILSDLVSNGLTGGIVDLSLQTPAAPPSIGPPDGIAAAATLAAEVPPWTVITD